MRLHSQETFQINLSGEHIGVVLEGLAELPFKKSNGLIRYIQQQLQQQLQQKETVDQGIGQNVGEFLAAAEKGRADNGDLEGAD